MEKQGYAGYIFIYHVDFRIIDGGKNCQVILSRDQDLEEDFYKFCLFIIRYWVKPWLRLETRAKAGKYILQTELYPCQWLKNTLTFPWWCFAILHFCIFLITRTLACSQRELFYPLKILWTKLPGSKSLFLNPLKLFLSKSLDLSVRNIPWALKCFNYITFHSGKFNPTNIYREPTTKSK